MVPRGKRSIRLQMTEIVRSRVQLIKSFVTTCNIFNGAMFVRQLAKYPFVAVRINLAIDKKGMSER